jgi:hypothetical protein
MQQQQGQAAAAATGAYFVINSAIGSSSQGSLQKGWVRTNQQQWLDQCKGS